jgi:hypothetical protein
VNARLRALSKALPRTAIIAHVATRPLPKPPSARVSLLADLTAFGAFLS